MKIAFIGFGKMARAIEELALAQGHEVVLRLDKPGVVGPYRETLRSCDVAFEFTAPAAAAGNLEQCISLGVPVVCGTTGWYDELPRIEALLKEHPESAIFYAPNFSLGINITLQLTRQLAGYLKRFEGYGVSIEETHHTQKLDAPSGTAILLANPFIREQDIYPGWGLVPEVKDGDLPITAHRVADIPGTHGVLLKGENDQIFLEHRAFNRKGLAQGAMAAADFIIGKAGLYTMDDLMA